MEVIRYFVALAVDIFIFTTGLNAAFYGFGIISSDYSTGISIIFSGAFCVVNCGKISSRILNDTNS